MGYRIMYSPEDDSKYPIKVNKRGRMKWVVTVVVALAILLGAGKPEIRRKAAKWLLPGDPDATRAAFGIMLEELRSGDGITEAVTAFCKEILNYGAEPTIHST